VPLLTLAQAELHYGDLPLLDRAALAVESGERIGLIGRNGTGKSSLLGVLAGVVALDDGELKKTDGLKIVRVVQEPTVPEHSGVEPHKLEKYLHLFGLTSDTFISGGERKKAALAHALAQEPDLLLLDEPTNHLDLDGILQLENLLLRMPAAIVVTHDRAFLDRVATRIVELDRGRLLSFAGNFSSYEKTKAAQLAAEAVTQRKFDRFWAQEEAWIRKGIEARRTRNEGRVRRLERLRNERAARRSRLGDVKIAIGEGQRSGKLVAELTGVSKEFSGRTVVNNLDLIVSRGDRLGFIGPNGAGKTTLLNLILGTLAPDSGSVRLGANVQVAYFDLRQRPGRLLRPAARCARSGEDRRRNHQPGLRMGRAAGRQETRHELPRRLPLPAAPREFKGVHALRRREEPPAPRPPLRQARQRAGAG